MLQQETAAATAETYCSGKVRQQQLPAAVKLRSGGQFRHIEADLKTDRLLIFLFQVRFVFATENLTCEDRERETELSLSEMLQPQCRYTQARPNYTYAQLCKSHVWRKLKFEFGSS